MFYSFIKDYEFVVEKFIVILNYLANVIEQKKKKLKNVKLMCGQIKHLNNLSSNKFLIKTFKIMIYQFNVTMKIILDSLEL